MVVLEEVGAPTDVTTPTLPPPPITEPPLPPLLPAATTSLLFSLCGQTQNTLINIDEYQYWKTIPIYTYSDRDLTQNVTSGEQTNHGPDVAVNLIK